MLLRGVIEYSKLERLFEIAHIMFNVLRRVFLLLDEYVFFLRNKSIFEHCLIVS